MSGRALCRLSRTQQMDHKPVHTKHQNHRLKQDIRLFNNDSNKGFRSTRRWYNFRHRLFLKTELPYCICNHQPESKTYAMKESLLLISLLFFGQQKEEFLVVDRGLKKPLAHATTFSTQLYLQRTFPVYATDAELVVAEIDNAVKWIEKNEDCACLEKFTAGRTSIVVNMREEEIKTCSITLITQVAESHTSYSFALTTNEEDLRKAKRRLLDVATYINP